MNLYILPLYLNTNPSEGTIELAQGDAEAIIDFTKDLLFLDISVILNMAVPLTIFAVYGLTLYAAVKYIQKKFS